MNPDQLLAKLKSLTGSLTGAQIASLVGAFVLVVGLVIGSAYWINRPSYALLFADMDPEAAAQVVERLTADNIPYQLDGGGRSIRVDRARVDELRLQFASQGLPASGRIGFELFDRTQFGQTEFLEQVNYRRALEGEIARTIATIDEVDNARVHIALGKDSLFTERAQPAKASVILKLRSNRSIPQASIIGITNLVASSVEGLKPEAVVVLDTNGRPLARPSEDTDEPLGGAQLERQQKLEKELATRVIALIEPVVGTEHVRVNVALSLRSDSEEQTEELYDPDTPVVRSRQTTSDLGAGGSATGGVAGSRGNLPPPAQASTTPGAPPIVPAGTPSASVAGVSPASRTAETTNYEISKTVRHTVRPRGDIERMSVAVILDHEQQREVGQDGVAKITTKPRDAEQLQKIQSLVSAAVGLDTERGDQLTVENISFTTPFQEEVAPPGFMERWGPTGMEVGRIIGVVVLGLVAIFGVIRPMLARSLRSLPAADAPLPKVVQVPKTVAEIEGEIEQELIAAANEAVADKRRLPVLTKRLSTMAKTDPQASVRLIKAWLAEDKK